MSKVILNIFYSDGSNQWIGPFKLEDDAIKYFLNLYNQPSSMVTAKEIRFLNRPIPS